MFLRNCLLSAILLPMTMFGFNLSLPTGELGIGYDYFHGIPDGDWDGNIGGAASLNVGIPLSCYNSGFQVGSSYGLYDWSGRGSACEDNQERVQQQLFITTGIFRRSPCSSGINAGIVYDWMWNKAFSVFGVQTNFSQLRAILGYQICCDNEFGLWGTINLDRSHVSDQEISLQYRALSQVNAYWRHSYRNGAETMLWVGLPYKRSLSFDNGRAGKFIVGATFQAPLCDRFCIEGHAHYMAPHSSSGAFKQRYYSANVCIELKYFFGKRATCDLPLLPVGNNTNFLTDTNYTY